MQASLNSSPPKINIIFFSDTEVGEGEGGGGGREGKKLPRGNSYLYLRSLCGM